MFLDDELRELKLKLSKMADIAIDMVEKSMKALIERDSDLIKMVAKTDDTVDSLDNEIDSYCLKLCALKQPKADDLRLILSSLKINIAIERIADNAVNIAEWAEKINKQPQLKPYIDLPAMKETTILMVKNALNAFFTKDIEKAKKVILLDDKVDNYEVQIIRELMTYVMENPRNIPRAIGLIFIARALERIADQATNIAEQAIFVTEGKIYKHHRDEK